MLKSSSGLRAILYGLGALVLLAALHAVFWFDRGRHHLVNHRNLADQFLNFGEVWLALLMVGLALPAALLLSGTLGVVFGRFVSRFERWLTGRASLLALGVLAALGSFLIAHFVHDYAWFTDDEQAYLYQAKCYLHGTLTGEVLEPRAALEHSFVVPVGEGGAQRLAGVYPVLQPLLMSLGMRLGNPNLSQFLMVLLVVYNSARFAQQLLGSRRAGFITGALCATSPMLLGLASTYHTAVLATALTVISGRVFLFLERHPGLFSGAALGAVAGSIVLARPMEGTLVVVMLGVALSVWTIRRGRRAVGVSVTAMLGYGLGGLLPLGVFLAVNYGTTGSWLAGPYKVLEAQIGGFFGFGDGMMWGRTHSPAHGLTQTISALFRMNNWLFAWPISLVVPGLALLRGLRNSKTTALLLVSVVQLSAYFFLAFGSVHDFGSAYHVWHLPIMATCTAWVVLRLSEHLKNHWPQSAKAPYWIAAGLTVAGLLTFWPAQLLRWQTVGELITGPVRAAEHAAGSEPAVVLWSSIQPPRTGIRSWVFRAPAPHSNDSVIWARDHKAFLPGLRNNFPNRQFFRLSWSGSEPVIHPVSLKAKTPQ